MTRPLWQQIRDALDREVAEGRFAPGDRMPTEAALAARFGVNRHTVRRALAAMQEAGVLRARQGAGVFVTGRAIPYRVGRRSRFSQNLEEGAHSGSRRILRLETLPCNDEEARVLEIAPRASVHIMEAVGIIEEAPALYARSVFPAEGLDAFPEALTATRSITAALMVCGIADYRRLWTRLTVEPASGPMAGHLEIAEGAPLMRAVSLNVTGGGRPVEHGRTWFCADRIELVVET